MPTEVRTDNWAKGINNLEKPNRLPEGSGGGGGDSSAGGSTGGSGTAGQGSAVAYGSRDTRDWWEFATAFERNNPEVLAVAAALGVGDASLDGLFSLAATL